MVTADQNRTLAKRVTAKPEREVEVQLQVQVQVQVP
jgi:hypothetical protein